MTTAQRISTVLLAGVVFGLPFEPRDTAGAWLGMRLSLLEAVAGVAMLGLVVTTRRELRAVVGRPTLPIAFIGLYALTHLASAAVVAVHRAEVLRFSVRMAAMAAFACLVAAAPRPARRAGLRALAAAGIVLAVLAIAEGAGLRGLDPFLSHFRASPFNVAGTRRATATTEYPNCAAAFLALSLQAWAGLALVSRWRRLLAVTATALLSGAILYTYSRGALLAAAAGLLALWATQRRRHPGRASAPLLGLSALGAMVLAFSAGPETFRLRFGSEGTRAFYGATYRPSEDPVHLRPGEQRRTSVAVTNTGSKRWTPGESFRLAYHLRRRSGEMLRFDGTRSELPGDVAPGDGVIVTAELRAPAEAGDYLVDWDMVHEGTTWFSDEGVPVATVVAVVAEELEPEHPAPAAVSEAIATVPWRPGRGELWSLALRLWSERPLLGVGPDNFRRLYGPAAGQDVWDERVYANNTLLETAATTGTLGLSALVGLFLSSGLRGLRMLREASTPHRQAEVATLLALLVTLVVHGTLDYFLAFTGHYLLFAFVVGSLGSREHAA